MKTANQLLVEIVGYVVPPEGVTICLTENPTAMGEQTNWTAEAGRMPSDKVSTFTKKIAELRISDPIVDWSTVPPPAARGATKRIGKSVGNSDLE